MRYRKLDVNGDYTLDNGAAFFVDTPEAVAQAVLTRLRLWQGEWFIDITDGTPWNSEILGKRQQGISPDTAVRTRILQTKGVTEILSYSSSFDGNTRKLAVTATVGTVYGTATITEVL